MRNFKDVHDRNKRRKQTKVGRFKTEHLSSGNEKTQYSTPEVSSHKLEKIKEEIRTKIKTQNRKNLLLVIVIFFILFYLIYYLFETQNYFL